MKPTMKCKLAVDAAMTVALLLLMAYGLVGETAHEWLGMGMFILFLTHHVLNRKWLLAIRKGRYTPVRMIQAALVGVILLCMLGSMVSGMCFRFCRSTAAMKRRKKRISSAPIGVSSA